MHHEVGVAGPGLHVPAPNYTGGEKEENFQKNNGAFTSHKRESVLH